MGFTRRSTDKDATWARAWTADTLTDLDDITALPGPNGPRRGDVAYVTSEADYYWWQDNGTWIKAGGDPVPTDAEGKVLVSQGIGIPPVYTNQPHLVGATAELRVGVLTSSRYSIVKHDEGSGAVILAMSDQTYVLRVFLRSDQVALAAPAAVPLIFTNLGGAPIIFCAAEAGGAGLIQFGRRFSDDNPAVGVRAEFWGITGQVTPVLAVMAPGGGSAVLEVDVDGNLRARSVEVTDPVFALKSSVALDDGAAGNAGTLGNAPAAGDPTKWIAIDDNGTTRFIPCW